MNETNRDSLSRRSFLIGTAAVGAGLTVGVYLINRKGDITVANPEQLSGHVPVEWDPQAFVRIGSDNLVTLYSKHLEMGQGIYTGLATLVAEELDAAWDQIRVEAAPADVELYANLFYRSQVTAGSNSIPNSFDQMRQVGAAARQMLIGAAVSAWSVSADEVTVSQGNVYHAATNRQASFGDLSELAAKQPVPAAVKLKTREQFQLIGKDLPRIDIPEKTNGTATYTQDINLPGMLTAVVAHPPRFGGTVRAFDAEAARVVKGVVDIVRIPSGIAVVAEDFWTASRARELLKIEWDESNAVTLGSDELMTRYKEIAKMAGTVAREAGSPDTSLENAEQVVEADFEFPYLAHAALEPLNTVVQLTDDGCEIWNAAQRQTSDQYQAAEILGLAPEQVKIHMLYAGGAFGRRAVGDYIGEAVEIVKIVNSSAPIKLVWTREDDMVAGQYRPLNYHRFRGGLDQDGKLRAWHHRVVCQSIGAQHAPGFVVNGIDFLTAAGADDWLYEVPDIRVDLHSPDYPIPVLWLRGTAETHTVFAVEAFMDELATAAGRDPVEFRRELLKNQHRMRNVLELAAEKANWDSPMAPGRGRGIAMCKSRETYLAQVAEVSVHGDDTYSVDRVITAVDCGMPVNPDNIRAQLEGGTGYGLSSTIGDEITLKNGYVEQSNFDQYKVLRINQMPDVEVHIVESDETPGGVGELGAMTIGPAVVNALHKVTGRRYRKLPVRLSV